MRPNVICTLALAFLTGPLVQNSFGAIFNLSDGNSLASFETASQANNFNWIVDGTDYLAQQAFWFRTGIGGPEQSVHTLPIGVQGTTDSNFDGNPDVLFVRYLGAGFLIETRYSLDGGTPGSGNSDLSEQISIINQSGGPLDFHFFEYADFDLSAGDITIFTNPNTVQQSGGPFRLTETVVTPASSHRETGLFPATLNRLNDGLPTVLNDTPIGAPVGPGDMTWAYQWDFILQNGDTFQISKDKNLGISPIPEPGVCSLLGLASLMLVSYRKRIAR